MRSATDALRGSLTTLLDRVVELVGQHVGSYRSRPGEDIAVERVGGGAERVTGCTDRWAAKDPDLAG